MLDLFNIEGKVRDGILNYLEHVSQEESIPADKLGVLIKAKGENLQVHIYHGPTYNKTVPLKQIVDFII